MAQADREAFMLFGNIFQKWKEHLFSNLVSLFYRPAEIAQEDLHIDGVPKNRLLLEPKIVTKLQCGGAKFPLDMTRELDLT